MPSYHQHAEIIKFAHRSNIGKQFKRMNDQNTTTSPNRSGAGGFSGIGTVRPADVPPPNAKELLRKVDRNKVHPEVFEASEILRREKNLRARARTRGYRLIKFRTKWADQYGPYGLANADNYLEYQQCSLEEAENIVNEL